MTINTTNAVTGPLYPNGVTTKFSFNFQAGSVGEVGVELNGVELDPSQFIVALNADGTGVITITPALAAVGELFIVSKPSFTQTTDWQRTTPVFPDRLVPPMDAAARRDIWLKDRADRALVLPRAGGIAQGLFPTVDADGQWVFTPSGPGATGPANNTYFDLPTFKAQPSTNGKATIVGLGEYYFTAGNFAASIDDLNFIAADGVSPALGAWVRQGADKVAYNGGTVEGSLTTQSNKLAKTVLVTDPPYNAIGDGVTDDSAAIMACIDANKGKTIVFPQGFTFLASGLILSGSTYNNTRLVVEGTLLFKSNIDGTELGTMNFQTTYCLIVFHDNEGCSLDVSGMMDGNRANMTNTREQIFLLCMSGARKFKVDRFRGREVRGDGIYVSISNFFSASTNSSDGIFGPIEIVNSADDGRNAVSVISGERITFGTITSTRVGGIVRGIRQPGGFDIEPDNGVLHKVDSVSVGMCNIMSMGTTALAVLGQPATAGGRDWNTTNISIADFLVNHTGDGSTGGGPAFWGVRTLTVRGQMHRTVARGGLMEIIDGDEIKADLSIRNCGNGFTVGARAEVRDSDIKLTVLDFSATAIHVVRTARCRISGSVSAASQASATGIRLTSSDTTIASTRISVDQYVGAFEHTGIVSGGGTIAATTYLADCEMVGFTTYAKQNTAQVASVNVKGRNEAAAIPTEGTWFLGDEVRNTAAVSYGTGKKYLRGWRRNQTGTNNAVDVGWLPQFVTGE